jgi:protein TonB
MFQESLVESTPLLRTNNRWPVFFSVAAQATIIALAIAIPLLHPEVLPKQALQHLDFLPSPVKPPAPPPPTQLVHLQAVPATNAPTAPAPQEPLINKTLAASSTSDLPPVANPTIAMSSGNYSGTTSPFTPGTTASTPHVVPVPTAPSGPISVSEGVFAGYLVTPIQPQYPAIARASGVQGTVIIQAIISKSGTIESAHVVSGPVLLQGSALQAVRNARYHPYLLNHQPTEVETTFSINFRLGSE